MSDPGYGIEMLDPLWYPSVGDVAALLRARTQDNDDQEIGTFNSDTRPTDLEVAKLILQAASIVYGATGSLENLVCSTKDQVIAQAHHMIALIAAMLVEVSYFPEQVKDDRSPYQQYYDLVTGPLGMSALTQAVQECLAGGVEPGGDGTGIAPASWAFPKDCGGLVGWQTIW